MLRAAVSLLVVAAAFAGCAGGDGGDDGPGAPDPGSGLSPRQFDILPAEEVWVPSSLDGMRLHQAVFRPATDGPVPVWINFSPYWGDTAMGGGDNFARHMVAEYVPRGYAVVLSALRGTGHSEGCFQIGGDLEVQDAHDVVGFFAAQPWSSGAVGAGGKSYDSTTQNGLIAKQPHPALRAVLHVSGITDMYRYSFHDGVPNQNGLAFTPRYFATQSFDEYGVGTQSAGSPQDERPESLQRAVGDAACPAAADHAAQHMATVATGAKTEYWQERDWAPALAQSGWNGSVFFVHGLQDWNVKPDHILPWLDALPAGVDVLGWLHQWSREPEGGHVYPMRADWNATMLRWMDHALKGRDTGMEGLWGFESQGTDGVWRRSGTWPPAPYELRPGEGLTAEGTPLRVTGIIAINVTATALAPDAVATVVVWDEAPDGSRTWVTEGVRRLLLRDGLGAPAPAVPGTTVTIPLEPYPIDHVLEPGHQLAFETGGRPQQSFATAAQLAGLAYTSLEATLPLAAPEAIAVQPEDVDCWAC